MSDFEFDADLFMAVRRAVSREDVRHYLGGVLIDPIDGGGAWLVATDGRMILAAMDESASAPRRAVVDLLLPESPPLEPGLCDFDCCERQPPSYVGARLCFSVNPEAAAVARIMRRDMVQTMAIADDLGCADKFPNWRKLFVDPQYEALSRAEGYIDTQRLLRLCDGDIVEIDASAPGSPIRIFFKDRPLVGLLMPYLASGESGARNIISMMKVGGDE